jgi:hypothetical protein
MASLDDDGGKGDGEDRRRGEKADERVGAALAGAERGDAVEVGPEAHASSPA